MLNNGFSTNICRFYNDFSLLLTTRKIVRCVTNLINAYYKMVQLKSQSWAAFNKFTTPSSAVSLTNVSYTAVVLVFVALNSCKLIPNIK